MGVLKVGAVEVRVWHRSHYLETVFPDGSKLPAAPQETDAYKAHALQMGYTDTFRSCLTHELLHTLYAQAKGEDYSQCLWKAANGRAFEEADYIEEGAVLAIQQAIGTGAGHELEKKLNRLLRKGITNIPI